MDIVISRTYYYFLYRDAMMQGFGVIWPELVSDLLAKRENGLEYTGITDYYRLLDEYLDNQLDPTPESNAIDDYVEALEADILNEIPTPQIEPEEPLKADTHEDILDNIIENYENPRFGAETSTVAVMEIKNPPGGQQEPAPKEASYNTYWWIGIAVVVTVIVVLIAIIARKRHSHRKQLEKQRRENTRA